MPISMLCKLLQEINTLCKCSYRCRQAICKNGKGGKDLLQTEATYKVEIINTAEYLNTKYKQHEFANILKSHESNQPNMNSTTKTAAKVDEELNKSSENSDTKKEGKIRRVI
jgi:hypothetical protein